MLISSFYASCRRLIAVSLMSGAALTNFASADECSLKVGVVPQFEQRRLLATWDPILSKLQDQTACSYQLVGSKSISEFEEKFLAGEFDLAYLNPYHSIMAHAAQGYVPLARSGEKKLLGILVVRKDSPVTDVKELDGQEIAFPSPNALGASLLMRAELALKHGINIKPRYVKTHSSVYLHVVKKLTEAGGGVGRTLKEQKDTIKDKLRVLYKTTPVNAHPLVIHPRVPNEKQLEIQSAFLALNEQNPEMLALIPMKSPIKATLEDYADLKAMELESFVGK